MTRLTEDRIVTAGVGVVRRAGWGSLSLRSVASDLDVTPMALYRHVTNADSLSATVLERVVEGLEPVGFTGDVGRDLSSWARSARAHLHRFPGTAGHLLVNWFDSPAMLSTIEALLALTEEAGMEDAEAVACVNAVFMFVLMRVEAESIVRAAGAVRRRLNLSDAKDHLPRLRRLQQHYTTARFDTHFEYGLAALLRGILGTTP